MIKHIIFREIQDHFVKLRFLLLGTVLVILFVFATFAFITDYKMTVENYKSPAELMKPHLSASYSPGNPVSLGDFVYNPITINLSPEPIWFFVNGNNETLPNYLIVNNTANQHVNSEIKRRNENPWVKTFGSPDWIYIIGLLGSFIAIALTYDAFTAEKEDGTLRLLLSNNIPRYKVLIGKLLGAFFALFFPLIIAQIISLIILNVSGSVNLGIYEYQKIACIVMLSWIYLSVFILMGMLVSSLTHNSSTSLIILLFLWIVLTVIIPGTSSIAARYVYKLPKNSTIEQQVFDIYKEAIFKVTGQTPVPGRMTRLESPGKRLNVVEYAKEQDASFRISGKIREDYRNKKFAQVDIARAFARISPYGTLSFGAEALAGVGLVRQKYLINQMFEYKNRLGEFILSEERRLSDDPKGFFNSTTLPSKAINTDAIPVFQEQSMTINEGFRSALLDMAILILYGFVFFTGAYVSFNRYDVR